MRSEVTQILETVLNSARQYGKSKEPRKALARLRNLLVVQPSLAPVMIYAAKTHVALEEPLAAREMYIRAGRTADVTGIIQKYAGLALGQIGFLEDTILILENARRIRSDDIELSIMLAVAYSKLHMTDLATKTLELAAETARAMANFKGLAKIVTTLVQNGEFEKLRHLVPDFVSIDPSVDQAAAHLRRCLGAGHASDRDWDRLAARPDLFNDKSVFYQLSRIFRDLWVLDPDHALETISRIVNAHSSTSTSTELRNLANELKGTLGKMQPGRWRECVLATIQGDGSLATKLLHDIVISRVEPPAVLNTVVESGHGAGHPVWHLLNPMFKHWYSAIAKNDNVQESWAKNPVVAKQHGKAAVEIHRDWQAVYNPLIPHVMHFVARAGKRSRYLDIGCGTGSWLRFLAEDAGVPISNLYGTDLHQNRVNAAVGLLEDLAKKLGKGARGGNVQDRFFSCDILNNRRFVHERTAEKIDVATLFFVTGCFEDKDLPRFLDSALSSRPHLLLHATVVDRWNMYRGRTDDEIYFRALGYDLVHRAWVGDPLDANNIDRALLPQQYWTSPRVDFLELKNEGWSS